MVAPTRFPAGLSTYTPKHVLKNFPNLPTPFQSSNVEQFFPYNSGDFTFTSTTSTATPLPWEGGALNLSAAAASSVAYIALTGNSTTGQCMQFVPGNQLWYKAVVAVPQATATSATTMLFGLFDTANPASLGNGIYFSKPASQTALNFLINKAGTTTTFTNVADLSKPSGKYGDTSSSIATITYPTAGTYATPTITSPGGGYTQAPLVKATGTAGTGAQIFAVIGSSTTSTLNNSGAISNVITAAPGSGYTSNTVEIDHWIELEFYYDGQTTLTVGVNGSPVFQIQQGGLNPVTIGGTNVVGSAGPTVTSWTVPSTTLLTTTTMTTPPPAGSVFNMVPLVIMNPAVGFSTNAVATQQNLYVESIFAGTDYN